SANKGSPTLTTRTACGRVGGAPATSVIGASASPAAVPTAVVLAPTGRGDHPQVLVAGLGAAARRRGPIIRRLPGSPAPAPGAGRPRGRVPADPPRHRGDLAGRRAAAPRPAPHYLLRVCRGGQLDLGQAQRPAGDRDGRPVKQRAVDVGAAQTRRAR